MQIVRTEGESEPDYAAVCGETSVPRTNDDVNSATTDAADHAMSKAELVGSIGLKGV